MQSAASKTLLAVMESRRDSELAERILQKISSPDDLVRTGGSCASNDSIHVQCPVVTCAVLFDVYLV